MADPIALAVDPGYHGGVAELWSDGVIYVVQVRTRGTGNADRQRNRLGNLICDVWCRDKRLAGRKWPRAFFEFHWHQRRRGKQLRSKQAVIGLGLTVGCWHAIPVEDKGLELVNPSTWMAPGWELETRSLEQRFSFSIPGDDARDALGLLLWARAQLDNSALRIPLSRFCPLILTA